MVQALIGLGGVVVGVLMGGTGKYFTQRRDAWTQARASGLLLLADVSALLDALPTDRVVAETELGVRSWESHRQALAGFRRGIYPNGFKASEWLTLAHCFAQLNKLHATRQTNRNGEWWERVRGELAQAEQLLDQFQNDPRVLPYVIRTGARTVLDGMRPARKQASEQSSISAAHRDALAPTPPDQDGRGRPQGSPDQRGA
jgi:hypothetical protein